jgi:hypothetical protein
MQALLDTLIKDKQMVRASIGRTIKEIEAKQVELMHLQIELHRTNMAIRNVERVMQNEAA